MILNDGASMLRSTTLNYNPLQYVIIDDSA